MEQHSAVMNVYDNGGETVDRYSVYALTDDGERYLFCSSPNPFHPMGVWSMCDSGNQWDVGEHLGKEVSWYDLPEDVQKAVIQSLPEDNSI